MATATKARPKCQSNLPTNWPVNQQWCIKKKRFFTVIGHVHWRNKFKNEVLKVSDTSNEDIIIAEDKADALTFTFV